MLGELVVRAWLSTALPAESRRAPPPAGAAIAPRSIRRRPRRAVHPDGGAPVAPKPPLVWLTIWDDGGEADDFARAAESVAGAGAVMRRGEAVALFLGPPDPAPAALETTARRLEGV